MERREAGADAPAPATGRVPDVFHQHRPLTSAPAEHFLGTRMYHFVISRWRYEGQRRRAVATGHAPARIPTNNDRKLRSAPAEHF